MIDIQRIQLHKQEGKMQDIYKIETRPIANIENIVQGKHYRISILTEGLIRLEYSEAGVFEDRATQFALNRDFPNTEFRYLRTEDGIEIHTSRLHLKYNEKEFSSEGLSIQVKGNISIYHSIWRYGEETKASFLPKLEGTARTLDEADGAIYTSLAMDMITKKHFYIYRSQE